MNFNKSIPEIEKKIGYIFKDKTLLKQAFTRESFCNEVNFKEKIPYQSSEVLEFFGDSVLSASIVTNLIKSKTKRYRHGIQTDLKEGDFSNIRSKLADKKNLSENIARLELQHYLIMGEGDEKLGICNERSVMEDLFESIIGAVYIDSDFDMQSVIKSVEIMLDLSVYLSKTKTPMQSPKNLLQEWCADKKRKMPPPVYKIVAEEGPDHDKTYTAECYVNDEFVGVGRGRNTKLAESAAATEAIIKLKIIK